jgi:DNA topoisomerase-1
VVVAFLESFFARYVEYDFTASLEEQLDRVANNEIDWRKVLQDFWVDFIGAVTDIKDLRVTEVLDALNDLLAPHIFPPKEDGSDPRQCPNCGVGKLSLKLGKFGAFIGCSNYPECRFTRQMTPGGDAIGDGGVKVLGTDPVNNLEVTLRSGRFGPYVQLGEAVDGEKPKRAGLPKGTELDTVDLAFALGLLALPREVGLHPESGEPIKAGVGRFGPYVQHEKIYANLEEGDDVLTIGLNRAVTLIEEKKLKPSKGRRFGADPGRTLGDHPTKGGPIVVKNGRYGPYATHGGVNATLPADKTPETITLEEAVGLIDARAEKGGGSRARRKAPPRKAASGAKEKITKAPAKKAAKKPAAKKAPAKKAAARAKS